MGALCKGCPLSRLKKQIFKSKRTVAQLVEYWFPKPGVASSSLACPATSLSCHFNQQSFNFMFQKTFKFIGEVKTELRKASWPWDPDPKVRGFKKFKELIDSTLVVLVAIILLAAYVSLWDLIHTQAVTFIGGLAQ